MKILIVALEYLEPEWEQTLADIQATGLPFEVVSRDGVGNMSRAYNSILMDPTWDVDYLWFVSNIRFDADVPLKLAQTLEKTGWAGIHPAMSTSDHRTHHKNPIGVECETPFIEFTAPMIRADVFSDNPLDEMLPYYYMDLDWAYRVREQGLKVGVQHGCEIGHTYLRNFDDEHQISRIRKQLRSYWTPISQNHMRQKWGKDWQIKMWPK